MSRAHPQGGLVQDKEREPISLCRSFVAIPLPTALQEQLASLQQELKQGLPGLRPSNPKNLHLSLLFLGDQSQKTLDKIGSLLQSLGSLWSAFTVGIRGVGGFPNNIRPRVVWLGIESQAALLSLQARLADGLCDLGLPPETRTYRPHLTLGRLLRPTLASGILESFRERDYGRLEVNRMVLFSSRLMPQGAVHQPLREIELNGSARTRHPQLS